MKSSDDPEEQSALKEATDFLADLLKDRSMSVKKIKSLSHQSGHSWITVRRAKEQLGIVHKKEPFGGDWIWRLLNVENQVVHTKDEQLNHDGKTGNFLRKVDAKYPYAD